MSARTPEFPNAFVSSSYSVPIFLRMDVRSENNDSSHGNDEIQIKVVLVYI
ncbi:hypothetical protein SAMN05443550_10141 [Pedobacter hartonius]|uniref:Uncharacterized protein n=1 Tax=Pedobacter hartonius TaxID=425514 RepID=A0A1H3W2E9_9SPHI|nr:hypothetical protein SAMN05443550_10141 [Pedobacter hartonius]